MRQRALLIAEIGINHGGVVSVAKEMASMALEAGADIAKFQMYRPAIIIGKDHPAYAEASKAQLSKSEHAEVKAYCDKIGIEYCVSLFHANDVAWAETVGVRRYKVASRSVNDYSLLNTINQTEKPVIMSWGGSSKQVVRKAIGFLDKCETTTLLYCVRQYPTDIKNMRPVEMFAHGDLSDFVGMSSHCPLIAPSLLAAGLGAKVIEHHVCVSRSETGVDISSSLDFEEFYQMAKLIRGMEACNGS